MVAGNRTLLDWAATTGEPSGVFWIGTAVLVAAHRSNGLSRPDAYQLLGQAGRLRVGNMIDPFYSVLATIERRYLDPA